MFAAFFLLESMVFKPLQICLVICAPVMELVCQSISTTGLPLQHASVRTAVKASIYTSESLLLYCFH